MQDSHLIQGYPKIFFNYELTISLRVTQSSGHGNSEDQLKVKYILIFAWFICNILKVSIRSSIASRPKFPFII